MLERRIRRWTNWAQIIVPALVIAGAAECAGQSLPVVFVPGTSGSILKASDGSVFWLDSSSLAPATVAKGRLNASGGEEGVEVLTTAGIVDAVAFVPPPAVMAELARFEMTPTGQRLTHLPIYAPFMRWGRTTFGEANWSEAPYDWRKGAGPDVSKQIDATVDETLRRTGATKVILVAHSLGGLVCRDYIEGPGRGKVDAIVSVGTPWLGALKTARGLAWGYNFGVGFTARPSRFLPNLYWYARDEMNPGSLTRFDPPLRLTFLDNEATALLAANYPSAYQQLPTDDYMDLYGKSIIFGLTPEQAKAKIREKNPRLFDESLAWRRAHLDGDNHGVAHVLIAGLCDPGGDPGEFQEMQMALPGPESLTAVGRGLRDRANDFIINQRRRLFDQIKARGIPLYLDEFIATDRDVSWGDGTAPVLSATAGAQVRAGATLDPSKAEKFLGPGAKVKVLMLERPYSHGSMVDDLGVRQEIIRAVSGRRVAAGRAADPRAGDVGIMTLELTTKASNPFFGTVDRVVMTVGGTPFSTNGLFNNGRFPSDSLVSGATARYDYHAPEARDAATGAMRPLRGSDLSGRSLVLTKGGFSNWTCVGVRLRVDGLTVLDDPTEFSLRGDANAREIRIPPF